MPRLRGKNENDSILKEIYDGQGAGGQSKKETFEEKIKSYFQDDQKVEKYLSIAILSFGLAAILLGFFQFRGNLTGSFLDEESTEPVIFLEEEKPEEDLLGLRTRDTDLDGLSDYDEINIYNTSPYLEDTDSDGVSDKEEIARGTDPTCAENADCFLGTYNTFQATPDDILLGNQFGFRGLRESLLEAGVAQETLDGLDDNQLLLKYQQLLVDAQIEGATGVSITSPKDPKDLTPEELRNLLRQAGVTEETLNLISDAELLELVQEIVPSENIQ